MLLGDLVNVLIGLSFTFALISLITSAMTEAVASAMKWRASTLLKGLRDMLNDPALTGLAGQLLTHAAINPQAPGPAMPGAAPAGGKPTIMPSYIDSAQFATAFIDILRNPPSLPGAPPVARTLDDAITAQTDPQLKMMLRGIYDRADGDITIIRKDLATWFDNAMDRVSGVYKRYTLVWNFVIALGLTVLLNVSAVEIAGTVWTHGNVIAQLPKLAAGVNAKDALAALPPDFPIGWGDAAPWKKADPLLACAASLFGWLITAFATLFGAPFWFDALSNITRLRGTGGTPPSLGSSTP